MAQRPNLKLCAERVIMPERIRQRKEVRDGPT